MAKEIIDIYNENLESLGQMERTEAHRRGHWHKSIHCWVVRPADNGYVLFQKRGAEKQFFPDLLDITAAGHYSTGERQREGVREIVEELGLQVRFEDLRFLGVKIDISQNGDLTNREFCDVFLLKEPKPPSEYSLDPTEVEGLVQVAINDGLRLFSGQASSAPAEGIQWQKSSNKWQDINLTVDPREFIPRIDSYYLKIFICASGLLHGEKYLSI